MTTFAPIDTKKDSAALTGSTTSTPTVKVHRSRPSVMAMLGLFLGVLAAVVVATGPLAGLGVLIGALAVLAAIIGTARTSRSFVTGRGNAVVGLLLGLAAVAVGVLAMTGRMSWVDPATDNVARLHDWLGAHASWLTKTW